MKIGTYYYPEQWPREQWERDFDHIAAMGLRIVHMAEFAWFTLEPSPGKFDFDWLMECVEMSRARKLDVILCTPTAAPPIWLSHDEPSTLPIDDYGRRGRFGGRRHYSPTSSKFREATKRIVTAMADKFGDHPAVIGWQIDNEYGSGFHDQSLQTHAMFQQWLQRKYGTIDALNKAWGNQFWNTYYTDFSQILLPPNAELNYDNPHHHLDGQRFWSWAFADFNKLQADILKPKVGSRWITTNFMYLHPTANPGDMAEDLTLYAWDSYPVTGWESKPRDETFRLGEPGAISSMHDLMRSYKNRWALMEVQPGQTNWSGVPVLLYPGAVRLFLWTAIAHGAEFITVYRFRQPNFGTELFHHGLVTTDGMTPSPGGREFVQVIEELKKLDHEKLAQPAPDRPKGKAAMLIDFEQLWWYATLPQAKRWDQRVWYAQWYNSLLRLGLDVEVIRPDQEWPSDLSLIVAPGLQMVDDALVKRLDQFAANGGQLVLTCRTALMDRNGQTWRDRTAAPIIPLIGATIEAYDGLPADVIGVVEMDGKLHHWNVWGDLLYAESGTKVLAKYADQFYAGTAAITTKKHGSGQVTYCGVYAEQTLTDALLERVATAAGLSATVLPNRVQVIQRGPYKIALNYQVASVDVPAAKTAKFLIGGRKLEPAGVAVWTE